MNYSITDIVLILDPYFNVLNVKESFFEVQSVNTKHYWKIVDCQSYLEMYHRYPDNEEYHYQTCFGSIEDALLYIALHDEYKIYGKHHELYTRGTETFADYILELYKNRSSHQG